jgi:hypothetical protein
MAGDLDIAGRAQTWVLARMEVHGKRARIGLDPRDTPPEWLLRIGRTHAVQQCRQVGLSAAPARGEAGLVTG